MLIDERLSTVRSRIYTAAEKAGRHTSDIRLIAVSKTHPAEAIETAYAAGLRVFGENYADELIEKSSKLTHRSDISWVFIGQLQSNKIQKIVKHADEIQSIATEKHARYVQRYASEVGKTNYPVWIVVNSEDEESKQGASFDEIANIAKFIATECPSLALQGIMAIPPSKYSDQSSALPNGGYSVPDLYKQLRKIASETGLGKLSLGMTSDLQIAIAAGTDCIRIGTAIFGERNKQ